MPFPLDWPEARKGIPVLAQIAVTEAERHPDEWVRPTSPLQLTVRYDSSRGQFELNRLNNPFSRSFWETKAGAIDILDDKWRREVNDGHCDRHLLDYLMSLGRMGFQE